MIVEYTFEHVSLSINKSGFSLQDISFSLKQGEVLGIFGPGSSGKTSLLYLVCGVYRPDKGRIIVNGEDVIKEDTWKRIRHRMAVAFQFREDMFSHNSILDEFKGIFGNRITSRQELESLSLKALKWAGMKKPDILYRMPFHLSQGESSRLGLALVIAKDADCMILDEPTTGIEPASGKRLMHDLVRHCHRHKKIGIILSHDTRILLPLVDKSMILSDGRVINYGIWDEILDKYGLIPSVGLPLPPIAELAIRLKKKGFPVTRIWKNHNEASKALKSLLSSTPGDRKHHPSQSPF